MNAITKQQIAAFHGLLRKHGLSDDKADIVSQISNGRTRSTTQLTYSEAMGWINAMNSNNGEEAAIKKVSSEDPRKRMFNHIIAMAHEMGWIKQVNKVQKDGSLKLVKDYSDVHAWIEKYGYLKKPLNKYSYDELPALVTAFKSVYFGKLKSRNKF